MAGRTAVSRAGSAGAGRSPRGTLRRRDSQAGGRAGRSGSGAGPATAPRRAARRLSAPEAGGLKAAMAKSSSKAEHSKTPRPPVRREKRKAAAPLAPEVQRENLELDEELSLAEMEEGEGPGEDGEGNGGDIFDLDEPPEEELEEIEEEELDE